MKKHVFTGILALAMCLTLTYPVMAVSPINTASERNASDLTGAEIRLIESIFESSSDVKLVDNNGKDVKKEFTEKHRNLYNAGDYKSIIDNIADNSLTLLEQKIKVDLTEGENVIPHRVMLKRTASATKTIKLINDYGGLSNNKLILSLEAGYSVIDYNNTINGAESLIRIVSQQNVPETFQSKIIGRSGEKAVVSNDKKSIQFSANLHIQTISTAIPVGGLTQVENVSFFGYV